MIQIALHLDCKSEDLTLAEKLSKATSFSSKACSEESQSQR